MSARLAVLEQVRDMCLEGRFYPVLACGRVDIPEQVEACTMRSSHVRDTEEV